MIHPACAEKTMNAENGNRTAHKQQPTHRGRLVHYLERNSSDKSNGVEFRTTV